MEPHQVLSLHIPSGMHIPPSRSLGIAKAVMRRHTRLKNGADSRDRTDDIQLGRLLLYRLSYVRLFFAKVAPGQ